jgi:hypothetical protein
MFPRWYALLALILPVVPVEAAEFERCDHGFESCEADDWSGPWGGGTGGGSGRGAVVAAGGGQHVRSGRHAARLSVWDDGGSNAVAWVFLSERRACRAGARIRAGAHVYGSSTTEPLPNHALVQIRVEYYYDRSCESQIPTHVMLSEPFSPQHGSVPDAWQALEVRDRAPEGAVCVKVTILLLCERPGPRPATVWVDDLFLEQGRGRGPSDSDRTAARLPRPRR